MAHALLGRVAADEAVENFPVIQIFRYASLSLRCDSPTGGSRLVPFGNEDQLSPCTTAAVR